MANATNAMEKVLSETNDTRSELSRTARSERTKLSYGPVNGPFGVVVMGMDWDVDDGEVIEELSRALRRHLLLVFRGQESPTHDQSNTFWRNFGPLVMDTVDGRFHYSKFSSDESQQNYRRSDGNILTVPDGGAGELGWHNDQSHKPQYKTLSILEAIKFGDGAIPTAFRDMYTAFEMLPREWKSKLAGKQGLFLDPRLPGPEDLPRLCDAMHPLITVHPNSGRSTLFGSDWTIYRIAGMSAEDSAKTIEYLRDFCETNAPFYEHRWQEGDICVWDNVGVQHRRDSQAPGVERMLRLFEGVAEY